MDELELIPSKDELPEDNCELAKIAVSFRRLRADSPRSCPVSIGAILEYLSLEVPHGDLLTEEDLSFIRTAEVKGTQYWIWSFHEPGGGDAFATVRREPDGANVIGFDTNYYQLSPEQFILGSYYRVF
jgi:hypothetical protein